MHDIPYDMYIAYRSDIGFLLLYFQCKGPFRQFGKSTKSRYFLLCFALLFINNNM